LKNPKFKIENSKLKRATRVALFGTGKKGLGATPFSLILFSGISVIIHIGSIIDKGVKTMAYREFSDILQIADNDKTVKEIHITYMYRFVTAFDWGTPEAVRAIFSHLGGNGVYFTIELHCGCSYCYDNHGKQTSCNMCDSHYSEDYTDDNYTD